MVNDLKVTDKRPHGHASEAIVPRIMSYDVLRRYFGVTVDASKGWDATPIGGSCWRVVGFVVEAGVPVFAPKVMDSNQRALPQILVFRHWRDAPTLDVRPNPFYFGNAVTMWTKETGAAESPFGHGSRIAGNGSPGPDSFWVAASPAGQGPQYSDCVHGMGWVSGTQYCVANPVFQEMVKPEVRPQPQPGQGNGNIKWPATIDVTGKIDIHVHFHGREAA